MEDAVNERWHSDDFGLGLIIGAIIGMIVMGTSINKMTVSSSEAITVACQQRGYQRGAYDETTNWRVVCWNDPRKDELK